MVQVRILIAKCGLDGHDRGAKIIARTLRDSGCEVIYSGLHQTADEIVKTAIQEDVNGIGLSVLSGAHMSVFSNILQELKSRQVGDIVLFGGGIIPESEIAILKSLGVAEIFTPGTSLAVVSEWVKNNINRERS